MEKQMSRTSDRRTNEEKNEERSNSARTIHPMSLSESSYTRIVQNFILIWLKSNIDEFDNNDFHETITKLRHVINSINIFTNLDECMDFITQINDENIFFITSETIGQTVVPIIHDMEKISTIYILCENKDQHRQWTEEWRKLAGIFTDITSIYEALKQAVYEYDQNSISISFIPTSEDTRKKSLDQLDQSFMYTQIFKEILLTIDFEEKHIGNFINYCRELFIDNTVELRNVDKLQKEYHQRTPIWWYTYECFLYSMINRALGTMEVDIIIKLGFFVNDLHKHISQLHLEQYGEDHHTDSFVLYRGQGISQENFNQIMKTKDGLFSFNNFLSTSKNRQVSLSFARRCITRSPDKVGILFVMAINSSVLSTPFASINKVSYVPNEEEILFSMHSIFRIEQIEQIEQIDGNNRLWQVNLTLTSDNDPQLYALTDHIRNETFPHTKGWYRLSNLLIKMGEFNKAEQVCEIMHEQTSNDDEIKNIYHVLAMVNDNQGNYTQAIRFYEKSIEIQEKNLSCNQIDLATSYNNIGIEYDKIGEYSKALFYYEKALEIYKKSFPSNHSNIGRSYNNIGLLYHKMGEYSKALSSHEKAIKIYQETLPSNHPDLTTSYVNIGMTLNMMGEYSKALSFHKKALEIDEKTLPPNHPDLASSYINLGMVYKNLCEYSKAISSYEKALEIQEKSLSSDHPALATSYNNLGLVYEIMGENLTAFSFLKKALNIRQKTLSANHPLLALSYSSIATVYYNMADYSKALSYFEHAVHIGQQSLPSDHPNLQQYKLGLKMVKDKM